MAARIPERERLWREQVRRLEFDGALPLLDIHRGTRVLDLGAGDGLMAALMAEHGAAVTAVDPRPREPSHYKVQPAPAGPLPFPDGSFDRVFSSNVLEHVADLPGCLVQCRRVLASGGFMLHTMPTTVWRLLTILTRLPDFLRRCLCAWRRRGGRDVGDGEGHRPVERGEPCGKLRLLGRALWPAAHGTFPSAWHELTAFSDTAWRERFRSAGLSVRCTVDLAPLNSGHAILPDRLLPARTWLAGRGLAACRAYLVESPMHQGANP
jgi:SAM-dependent methyltransferase